MSRVTVLTCSTLATLLISGCAIEPNLNPDVPAQTESQVQPAPQQPLSHSTAPAINQIPQPVPVRPELIHCETPLANLTIEIPDQSSWLTSLKSQQLPSPASAVKAMIQQSACFTQITSKTDGKSIAKHYILKPEVSFGQTGLRSILSRGKEKTRLDATALLALYQPGGPIFAASSGHATDISTDGDWKALFTDTDTDLYTYLSSEQGTSALSALLDAYNQLVLTVRQTMIKPSSN